MVCLPWYESFVSVVLNAAVGFVPAVLLQFFIKPFPQPMHKQIHTFLISLEKVQGEYLV